MTTPTAEARCATCGGGALDVCMEAHGPPVFVHSGRLDCGRLDCLSHHPFFPAPASSEEVDELRALFEMEHARTVKATMLWRAESPEERAHTLPDLGKLIDWLLARADRAGAALGIERGSGAAIWQLEKLAYVTEQRNEWQARAERAEAALTNIARITAPPYTGRPRDG